MATFDAWVAALEARHLSDLTFSEVARALRALSSAYVERREQLAAGAALSGAGKRAAFALFYAPLHYLLVSHIVQNLPGAADGVERLIDLGCGTGASGAAWAAACTPPPRTVGVDRHPWALHEAGETYRAFGIGGRAERRDLAAALHDRHRGRASAGTGRAILAAYLVNELAEADRARLHDQLLDCARAGDRILVVEPIGRVVGRWWNEWRRDVEAAGGRADEWRVKAPLPSIVAKLDRAAGLDHREITGRSLWIGESERTIGGSERTRPTRQGL